MDTPNLSFESHGDSWLAMSQRCEYVVRRDFERVAGGGIRVLPRWVAIATVFHASGQMSLEREYTATRATLDGAMLACRTAERDGFDGWSASGDTPNTSADAGEPPRVWTAADWRADVLAAWYGEADDPDPERCGECGADLPPGDEPCRDCRVVAAAMDAGQKVRIAMLTLETDHFGRQDVEPSICTLADFIADNEHVRDHATLGRLLALRVGESWSDGGGAAPWYAIVRLPNDPG